MRSHKMKKLYDYTRQQAIIVTATKEIVDWLLSLNTNNRAIKNTHINYIRNQIKNGNWYFTNQGIGVSKKGVLTDGQHRLIAIVKENYPPVELLLVLGLDDMAQAVVDTHAKRSQADVIRLLMNRTVSNQAIAALNVTLLIRTDGLKFSWIGGKTDTFELSEIIADENELLTRLFTSCGTGIRTPVMAALIEYARLYSIDYACNLGEQIKDGLNLTKDDPAYRLRDWLAKNKTNGAATRLMAYSVAVSACIAHAKSEKLQVLRPASSWARLPKLKLTNHIKAA